MYAKGCGIHWQALTTCTHTPSQAPGQERGKGTAREEKTLGKSITELSKNLYNALVNKQ